MRNMLKSGLSLVCFMAFTLVYGQSSVWQEIHLLEQKVNDTTLQDQLRSDAIIDLEHLFWGAAPRFGGKYIALMEQLVAKTQSQKMSLELGLIKIRFYFNQGRFQQCFDECMKSLQLAKKLKASHIEVRILANLQAINNSDRSGNIAGMASSAKEYLTQAKAIHLGPGHEVVLSTLAQNEAGYMMASKDIESAINVLLDNLKRIETIKQPSVKIIHYAFNYNLLGRCFLILNKLDESEKYLSKAEHLSEKYNLGGIKYIVYLHKALLKEKEKRVTAANAYYDKCLGQMNVMSQNKQPAILGIVANFYEKHGRWQEAYKVKKNQSILIDSLFDAEKLATFVQNQEKLKTKDKELQINTLTIKNELNLKEKRNLKLFFIIVITILLCLLLIGLQYYFTKKDLIELTERKQIIMSLLAHDIRSPVLGMKAGLPIMVNSLQKGEKIEVIPRLRYLNHTLTELNSNIENLFYFVNIKSKNRKFLKSEFHVWNELETIIDEIRYKAVEKHIDIILLNKSNATVYTDRMVFVSIFRNILNNAIQYSYENSKIEIEVYKTNNLTKVKIRDFGPGIDPNTMKKLMNGENLGDETNKFENKGSQIGLHVSLALAKANGIELQYVNKQPGLEFLMII